MSGPARWLRPADGDTLPVEDVRSRTEQKRESLYRSRVEVYPKAVRGPVRRAKWAVLAILLGLYYVAPWLRWDRGPGLPDQAFLIDMPGRRAYFLWIEIWPQEVYYLAGLLMLGAFGLFLATALFGRVWCGYACPQTVWTDLFMLVERWTQGDRAQRIRLDKAPWSANKILRKSSTHAAWLTIAFLTGGAWVMYFQDAPTLVRTFFVGDAGTGTYFFVALFTATTYLLAGFAREQVCTYMCPWPRIQAAMLDEDSFVVTYQRWRGEARAPFRKGQAWEDRGDCIDCRQCVAVCPTGIDIRDGLQLECIGCGLCIDACNDVMRRIGRPQGLIGFFTERSQAAASPSSLRLIRPRTLLYAALIFLGAAIMAFALGSRASYELSIQHDRNPLFVTLSDGSIRNGYTLKVTNKTRAASYLALTVEGVEGLTFEIAGGAAHDRGQRLVQATPGSISVYHVFVRVPASVRIGALRPISFSLSEPTAGTVASAEAVFRGPIE